MPKCKTTKHFPCSFWYPTKRKEKDSSDVTSTCYSSRGPGFDSQKPYGVSQPFLIPVLGDPSLASGYKRGVQTYREAKHPYTLI